MVGKRTGCDLKRRSNGERRSYCRKAPNIKGGRYSL
jgi:hypothetical protein